jgi:hypothetical protein
MAQEPGGGSGEPYNRFEDLNYNPGYSIQDWLRNMMQQGNIGATQPMGTGTPDFMQEIMRGRMPPSDLGIRGENPQDFIRQQLAGDVVPMYGQGSVPSAVIQDRLNAPGASGGSMGLRSVGAMGGSSNPYLDLLNVLAYPQGGQLSDRLRGR